MRALRWRRLSAVFLLVVAVAAIAGAAVGPIFLRGADDSTVTDSLRQAVAGSTGVAIISTGGAPEFARMAAAARVVTRLGRGRWFSPPVLSADAGVAVRAGSLPSYSADLLSRSDVCARIHITSGSCPRAPREVAVSTRSASEAGFGVGQSLDVSRPEKQSDIRVRVVGIYVVPTTVDDDYWNGTNYFAFGETGPDHLPRLDPLLAVDETVLSSTSLGIDPQLGADDQLRPGTLRSDAVGVFENDLHSAIFVLARKYSLTGSTQVFSVLAGAELDERSMATVVEVIGLQLVLLTLLVLYSLVGLSGRERQLEIELARRRGFPRRSLLVVAIGEPVVLLTAALPLGVLIAWAVVALAGRALFVAGTPVTVTFASIVTAVAGFLGGMGAAIVASWGLWHGAARVNERQSRRRSAALAADAFAVALAGSGLIGLAARGALGGSRADPVALLAPGLLGVGAGVIGLRLAGLGVRAALRPSRDSHRVAWFLVVRDLARRWPSTLRQLLPLTVAVVLTLFAVCSWALASSNRSAVAAFDTGAARVANVEVAPGVNLVKAVRAADPSGRSAMAAAIYRSRDGDLLALDAPRLAAVASWPSGLTERSAGAVGRYLSPPTLPPVEFAGDSLRAKIAISPGAPPIDLAATVYSEADEDQSTIVMGPLLPGTRTYVGDLGGFCASTCRLVDLSPTLSLVGSPAPRDVDMTVEALAAGATAEAWRGISFGSGLPGSWVATPSPATVTTHRGTTGVSFSLPTSSLTTQGILLTPADVPNPIPLVVTDVLDSVNAPAPPDDAQTVSGLDGGSLNGSGEIQAPTLPEIGGDAALVDLSFAQLVQAGPARATYQVWLAASAPSSILHRLRALGVTVSSIRSATAAAAALDKDPLALAYLFALYCAPVAALLAIGAGAYGLLATGRRRRRDLRALTVVGVSRRTVVRSMLLEAGLVLGVALVIGSAVGFAAAAMALSSLPQFPDGTGGVPIGHALALGPFVVVVVALAVVFALTAVITTYVTLRGVTVAPAIVER